MQTPNLHEDSIGEARRFLLFRVAQRHYAAPAETIVEVIRIPPVARVPQAPRALLGVANLRGVVLPLVSARGLLGIAEAGETTAARAIVWGGDSRIAIAVDAVETLIDVASGQIETQPAHLSAEPGERLTGAFPLAGGRGAAKILDIDGLVAEAFARRASHQPKTVGRGVAATAVAPERRAHNEALITFDIAGQEFAFPLDFVEEIVALPSSITALPRADASTLGMMPFREQLLPLLSLRSLLGFPPASNSDGREKIVVASVHEALVGLVVDRAHALVSADPALVEPAPLVLVARMTGESRIKSIYRGDEGRRLISILAPERLFREDVMERLEVGRNASKPSRESEAGGAEQKFLIFRLGDDEYGLPVEQVEEVARVPDHITRVPKTPKFLEGVVNLRGEVVPVVDQRRRFDMPKLEKLEGRRLIVLRTERHRAGLIVDSVSEVLGASVDAIEPAPDLTGEINRLVRGVVNRVRDGRIILLLEPAELLTRAEQGVLDAFKRKGRKPT
jgi:purine-binding chemotaxis protein CheW